MRADAKQYRYHPKWRAVRDETKYHRMIGFAQALPDHQAHGPTRTFESLH